MKKQIQILMIALGLTQVSLTASAALTAEELQKLPRTAAEIHIKDATLADMDLLNAERGAVLNKIGRPKPTFLNTLVLINPAFSITADLLAPLTKLHTLVIISQSFMIASLPDSVKTLIVHPELIAEAKKAFPNRTVKSTLSEGY